MNKIPLIIDTDPGIDDILAIILAAASDKYEIKALTATHGNVGLVGTSQNALHIADMLKLDCIVAKGAEKPLIVPQKNAAHIHGSNGAAGFEFPKTHRICSEQAAWDVMYSEAKKAKGELVLVVLGPMTNVAIALLKYPDLAQYIKRIYMMGGSRSFGNHSQNAEFNIWGDPHACEIVLQSGVAITMADLIFGNDHPLTGNMVRAAYDGAKRLKPMLDAFWQHDMQWLKKEGEKQGKAIDPATYGFSIYDATAVAAMLLQEELKTEDYYVLCETQGSETQGQTVFDYKGQKGKAPNVQLAVKMPIDKYYKLFAQAMAHFE
ncbi:MAG: nucleoside hydrolase [Oscillospiraceae bacterium]